MKGATRNKSKQAIPWSTYIKPVSATVTAASLLLAVVLLITYVANKPVEQLQVVGNQSHITKVDIVNQLGELFPSGYLTLDVHEIEQTLLRHPLIAKASVKKIWPNVLSVALTEEVPVARWNGSHMLSEHGEVIPISLSGLSLPSLRGQASELVMEHYLLFNRWSKRHNLNLTELSKGAGWLLSYDNGLTIRLDSNTAMKELEKLESVIDRFQIERVSSIDMRYEQGFAVAWKHDSEDVQG
ncbi:FtsQ-type POTRA domain-containing protein [Bermanella marisrubri]|uniref:Cell division protein FtsQ n=1 Tax=Bermanella marisrubri TaxID=207949 RepID=Q1MYC3_9GAMM|nr:FtsQ-type POTRA domain-containing protein [Bermanella marisrubri]EAT10944.1 cell division protein; ingrowth of wall at septum [Oceanobacter sp. RED65] [Bermanella marisrubri]QIZ85092.1 FtsQ-type POTRA domain-containing protein [Bermanella marisrubri]